MDAHEKAKADARADVMKAAGFPCRGSIDLRDCPHGGTWADFISDAMLRMNLLAEVVFKQGEEIKRLKKHSRGRHKFNSSAIDV